MTPYNYLIMFLPDSYIDKIVKETKRYTGQQNNQDPGSTGIWLAPATPLCTGADIWRHLRDSCIGKNALVKKAMSRNTFDGLMRYTHFANLNTPNKDDPFWKAAMLFKTINDTQSSSGEDRVCQHGRVNNKIFRPSPPQTVHETQANTFGFKVGSWRPRMVNSYNLHPLWRNQDSDVQVRAGARTWRCLWNDTESQPGRRITDRGWQSVH